MSQFVRGILENIPFGPLHKVRRFLQDPVQAQSDLLRRLLKQAAPTEWGGRYAYDEIAREQDVVKAYQSHVPLHEYKDFRPFIERMRKGATDILWPGRFDQYAISSGTASAGKLIPVSRQMLAENRSFSFAAGLNYIKESGNLQVLFGRHLTLPGRIENDREMGYMVGEVSGLQAEDAPVFFKTIYQAVPNEIAFLPNWEQKLDAIVSRTVDMDVRLLVMVPSWAMVFFKLLIARYQQIHGRRVSTVTEIWPNLQVFISGGVALSSYRELLEHQIGKPDLHYVETYGASEGFFSFQSDLEDPSMLLHMDNGLFFEFVRMDELHTANPQRFTVADVEPNVRYALYVSTCSGLWSYAVRDVIRFTQTFPHKITVAGRTSEMIDKYGEAVFSEEARAALHRACERTGAQVLNFHVAPFPVSADRSPKHQWLVEFERPPTDLSDFAQQLDSYLLEVNRHYQIRREARAFDAPEVVPLPEGTFYEWLKLSKGNISGQTKVPRMSEERIIADGVLALVGNNR